MIKRITVLLSFFFLFISSVNGQINKEDIVFQSEVYDFGTVKFGKTIINATFIFKNHSDVAFEIRDVRASCGCTVPSWPEAPIPPGGMGVITATFDPSNLAGEVDKSIEIFANYNVIMSKLLFIRGIINEPIQVDRSQVYPGQYGYIRQSRNTLGFGDIVNTKSYSKKIIFVNDYNLPLTFVDVVRIPEYCTYELSNKVIAPNDTVELTVTIDGEKVNDYGLINGEFVLKTNDKFFPLKAVKIAFFIEEDFSQLKKKELKNAPKLVVNTRTFDFGSVKEGGKRNQTLEVKNSGKTPLVIYKVETTCGCTAINLKEQSIAPGETLKALITFDSIFITGNTQKEIILFTNDPNNHVVRLLVTAEVLAN